MSLMLALHGGATAYADTLLKGTYTLTGIAITDRVARNDALSKGTYNLTGVSISDLVARNDTLSTGVYPLTGQQITDVIGGSAANYADDLSTGSYTVSGKNITDDYQTATLPYTMGGGLVWRNTKHDKRKYEEELEEAVEVVEKVVHKKVDKQALISFFNAKYKQEIKQALVTRLEPTQKQAIQRKQQELLIRQRKLEREYEDEDEILMLLAA